MINWSGGAGRGGQAAPQPEGWGRLLVKEQAAPTEAEAATAQLRALQALTDTALSHLALDDLLRELLCRVTGVMSVDQVGIFLLDKDGRTLTLRGGCGLLEEAVGFDRFDMGQGLPGRIAMSREFVIVDPPSAVDFDGAPPLLRERLRSAAGVPLLVEDPLANQVEGYRASRLVGVLLVGSATPHHFTEADVQLLQRAADRIALAIDRARLYAAEQEARRQAEAALARAQASEAQATARAEQLHAILETMTDAVAVYDTQGRLQVVNRAYRELHAVERGPAKFEALPGRERVRLLQVRDGTTGAPLPFEDTPAARVLRGEVVTGPGADIRLQAFDGRELELNGSAAPLRDPDGRIVGAVLVLRDMTERNRLARAWEVARVQAERQAEQLDRIFEAAADGLVVWDAEGRIVRVNPAARRILGLDAAPPEFAQLPRCERFARYAMRDEQGRPLLPEEWPGLRTLGAEGATGTETGSGIGTGIEVREVRLRALDGRELELNDSTAPLRDRDGRLVGAVCVMHDITERNRLAREREAARADELAAREASRRMEGFLAVAAHDLRAPLTGVVGYLALAERQTEQLVAAAEGERPKLLRQVTALRQRLEDASLGAERLARLLSLLFDTAAIRADRLELYRVPCDVVALAREQVEALRAAAPSRAIRLHVPEGGKPVLVEADADRIRQVVANYLTNALKYSPPDRPVDVSVDVCMDLDISEGPTAAGEEWARVAVRDAGPGIPEVERARVWELFHRAPGLEGQSRTQSGAVGGSLGLGLYICKAIVEAHTGRVGMKSAIGEGSTFWFTLPLAGPAPGPSGAAA